MFVLLRRFQSTHPGWGATLSLSLSKQPFQDFNPRTPGGVRPRAQIFKSCIDNFNPRTPGGVRLCRYPRGYMYLSFQSTHPGWGATHICGHATFASINFNPRTPGGVRHGFRVFGFRIFYFNPRTPGGVRQNAAEIRQRGRIISIHAPRVGCDEATT